MNDPSFCLRVGTWGCFSISGAGTRGFLLFHICRKTSLFKSKIYHILNASSLLSSPSFYSRNVSLERFSQLFQQNRVCIFMANVMIYVSIFCVGIIFGWTLKVRSIVAAFARRLERWVEGSE